MIIHCKQCGINWAKLWSSDDGEGDVVFCPGCGTDSFLEVTDDFVGYIKCPITGRITNAFTGDLLSKEIEDAMAIDKPRVRVVVGKPERETKDEQEARELAGIDAYHQSGNINDYFSNIKKNK